MSVGSVVSGIRLNFKLGVRFCIGETVLALNRFDFCFFSVQVLSLLYVCFDVCCSPALVSSCRWFLSYIFLCVSSCRYLPLVL